MVIGLCILAVLVPVQAHQSLLFDRIRLDGKGWDGVGMSDN